MKKSRILRLWLLVFSAVLVLTSCAAKDTAADTYATKMSFYVTTVASDGNGEETGIDAAGLNAEKREVEEVITMMKAEAILSRVAKKVGSVSTSEMREMLTIEAKEESATIVVTVVGKDADLVQDVANAYVKIVPGQIEDILPDAMSIDVVDKPGKPALMR